MPNPFKAAAGLGAFTLISILGATQDLCTWNIEGSGDWTRTTDDCIDANNNVVACPDAGTTVTTSTPDAGSTPEPVTVEISSPPTHIGASDVVTLFATVRNATSPGVVWSLESGSKGSINGATGEYTAPEYSVTPGTNQISTTTTVSIRATSIADYTKYDIATITVLPYHMAITPSAATLNPGGVLDFEASVVGDPTDSSQSRFVWYVLGGGGSVNVASGVFTAPPTAGATYVRCTSVTHPGYSVLARVTITTGPLVVVNVEPEQAVLVASAEDLPADAIELTPSLTNATDTSVTWELVGTVPTGATLAGPHGRTLSAGSGTGTFRVRARSVEDPSKTDEVDVTIVAASSVWRLAGTVTRVSPSDPGPIRVTVSGRLRGTTVAHANGSYELTAYADPDYTTSTTAVVRAWRDPENVAVYVPNVHDTGTATIPDLTSLSSPLQGPVEPILLVAAADVTPSGGCPAPQLDIATTGSGVLAMVRADGDVKPVSIEVQMYSGSASTGTPVATREVPAGSEGIITFGGLASATAYTFVAVAHYDTTDCATTDVETSDQTITRPDPLADSGEVTLRGQANVAGVLGARLSTGGASVLAVTLPAEFGSSSSAIAAARSSVTPANASVSFSVGAQAVGLYQQILLVDTDDDGVIRAGEPRTETPNAGGVTGFDPAQISVSATVSAGAIDLPALTVPATDAVGRAGVEVDGSTKTAVLRLRPNRRLVSEVVVLSGPAVANLTYPFSLALDADGRFDWTRVVTSSAIAGTFVTQIRFADGSVRNSSFVMGAEPATPGAVGHAGAATANFVIATCGSGPTCTSLLQPVLQTAPPTGDSSSHYEVKATAAGNLMSTSGADPTVKFRLLPSGSWSTAFARNASPYQLDSGPAKFGFAPGGGTFAADEVWDVRFTFERVDTSPVFTFSSGGDGTRLIEVRVEALPTGSPQFTMYRRMTGSSASVAWPFSALPDWSDLRVKAREHSGGGTGPWSEIGKLTASPD